jgi:phenylalanyl-tRNA synthetase beta chain
VRVPVSWLREYVPFDLPPRELGERLSMTGTKLEALHRRGVPRALERYRVGRVLSREQHPNADRLSLCSVDIGGGEPQQIVCGARNFEAGATVAVALPGAVLPDGTELRVAKLRGLESHGMMLSERELGLGQNRTARTSTASPARCQPSSTRTSRPGRGRSRNRPGRGRPRTT